ncbi:hypothetical protein Vadar_014923 [Vaccinium darrowii]|uniref:Uncharacterized protein n=1 Tax=Vaccinium darrowii TaxID=229202 RepID=A0ACB7ZJE3_9ERIC|nr:hypothetical protein Vadar_014923 [Vaccinium darrowii]
MAEQKSQFKTSSKRKGNGVTRKVASLVKEQRARIYILRRCATILLCWRFGFGSWAVFCCPCFLPPYVPSPVFDLNGDRPFGFMSTGERFPAAFRHFLTDWPPRMNSGEADMRV